MTSFQELHLTPPTAAALERLGWTAEDPIARAAAPTAARGHNLVAFTPPVPAYAAPALAGLLSRLGEGRQALLLAPESQLDEWGALAHELGRDAGLRVQVAHGTARAQRRLKAGSLDLLIASPETALTLLRRSALPMDSLAGVFLAWPENWDDEDSITPLMQDLPKDTQRLIYTSAPSRVEAWVERYARKALTVGTQLEGDVAGAVRTVSVPWARRVSVLADLVELLDPASLVVWTVDRSQHEAIARAVGLAEPDLRLVTGDAAEASTIIAFDLPSRERLRQLVSAGEVVLLVPPGTEAYAARTAEPRRPLQLRGLADDVANAAAGRRAAIVKALETGRPDRAILTLAPLFERHDPAAVAAALYELWTTAAPAAAPARTPDIPATAKIYVGIGKKDGATANDLVAVLTKELRVDKGKIGRIELRDAYSLIEIPAQDAEKVATGLNGSTVRRKRVTARVDRGPSRGPTAGRAGGGPEARTRRG